MELSTFILLAELLRAAAAAHWLAHGGVKSGEKNIRKRKQINTKASQIDPTVKLDCNRDIAQETRCQSIGRKSKKIMEVTI